MSEYHIEDTGNGTYALHVGLAEIAKIKWLHGERVLQMHAVGPVDFGAAVTTMQVYGHMVALLGQELGKPTPPQQAVIEILEVPNKRKRGRR